MTLCAGTERIVEARTGLCFAAVAPGAAHRDVDLVLLFWRHVGVARRNRPKPRCALRAEERLKSMALTLRLYVSTKRGLSDIYCDTLVLLQEYYFL